MCNEFKNKLLKDKIITQEEIDAIEKKIEKKIDDAVKFAENSPEPELNEFLTEISS